MSNFERNNSGKRMALNALNNTNSGKRMAPKSIKTSFSDLKEMVFSIYDREERPSLYQTEKGNLALKVNDKTFWANNPRGLNPSQDDREVFESLYRSERMEEFPKGLTCPWEKSSLKDNETKSASVLEHTYADKFCPHCWDEDEVIGLISTEDGFLCPTCGYLEVEAEWQTLHNDDMDWEVRDSWSPRDRVFNQRPVSFTGFRSDEEIESESVKRLDLDNLFNVNKDGLKSHVYKTLKKKDLFIPKKELNALYKVWKDFHLSAEVDGKGKEVLSVNNKVGDGATEHIDLKADKEGDDSASMISFKNTEVSPEHAKFWKDASKDLVRCSYYADKVMKGKSYFSKKLKEAYESGSMSEEEKEYWDGLYSLRLDEGFKQTFVVIARGEDGKLTNKAKYDKGKLIPHPEGEIIMDGRARKALRSRGVPHWTLYRSFYETSMDNQRSIGLDLTPLNIKTSASARCRKVGVFGHIYIAIFGDRADIGYIDIRKVFSLKEAYNVSYIEKELFDEELINKKLKKSFEFFIKKGYNLNFVDDEVKNYIQNL